MAELAANAIARIVHTYENIVASYIGQDKNGNQDTLRVLATVNKELAEEGHSQLRTVAYKGIFAKVATMGFRIPLFTEDSDYTIDDKDGNPVKQPWSEENMELLKKSQEDNRIHPIYEDEPDSRKNPLLVDFVKEHGRMPTNKDTFTVTSGSEIFVPTTFVQRYGGTGDSGKYGAFITEVLTEELWNKVPEFARDAQNCVYEILRTDSESLRIFATAPEVVDDTPQNVPSSAAERERW
jgi:hypothetical protein